MTTETFKILTKGDIPTPTHIENLTNLMLMEMLFGENNEVINSLNENELDMMCSFTCGSIEMNKMLSGMEMSYPDMFLILSGTRKMSMEMGFTTPQQIIDYENDSRKIAWNNIETKFDKGDMLFEDDDDSGMEMIVGNYMTEG